MLTLGQVHINILLTSKCRTKMEDIFSCKTSDTFHWKLLSSKSGLTFIPVTLLTIRLLKKSIMIHKAHTNIILFALVILTLVVCCCFLLNI